MHAKLKPLAEQIVVIAGGNSGLGLAAARAAAKAGAAVVMAASDETSLRKACEAISAAGGRAHPVVGDPTSAEGCERIARAATARFGRFDSWIDASGDPRGLAHAALEAARHYKAREGVGALVGFGAEVAKPARAEIKRGGGALATTMVRLPSDWRPESPADAVVAAALYAAARPMGRMAVARRGQRLTVMTEAQKHRGVILGVGLVALAGAVAWLTRERIAEAARPRMVRVVRPLVFEAARRRPMQAARLVAKHPRQALKVARFLK